MATHPPRLAPVRPAAAEHDLSVRTVWRWLESGRLTRYRTTTRTLVDLDQLADLLAPRAA